MFGFKSFWIIPSLFVLLLVLLVGCGGKEDAGPTEPAENQPPTAVISAPLNQSLITPGQVVQIDVLANDDQAVSRVELYVDNSLIESRVAPAGSALNNLREVFNWSASIMGSHTLQARVYDKSGLMGASLAVGVTVGSPQSPTSPPAVVTIPPTAPSEATATAPPAEEPTAEQALVTASTNANVRRGPGTNYGVVGMLEEGESAIVTGRNTDSSWWQISYQGSAAWIANSVVTASDQARNAPVVNAPPPPPTAVPATAVPPTATPPATNTPAPASGLRADQTTLSAGQCTTLRWDFADIKALYISFGFGYDKEGVPGSGTREVCPSVTTTYETTVVKPDSSQTYPSLTINVTGAGCGDPYITRFVPTTYDVSSDKPFSIFWDVDCAKSVRLIKGGGSEEPVGGHSSEEVTIKQDTLFRLKVGKNDGTFVYASFTVNVR